MAALFARIGECFVAEGTDINARFDRVGQNTTQIRDMELAMTRGFSRIDARFEQLAGLIKRNELTP